MHDGGRWTRVGGRMGARSQQLRWAEVQPPLVPVRDPAGDFRDGFCCKLLNSYGLVNNDETIPMMKPARSQDGRGAKPTRADSNEDTCI